MTRKSKKQPNNQRPLQKIGKTALNIRQIWKGIQTGWKIVIGILTFLALLATILAVFPDPKKSNFLYSIGLLPPSETPSPISIISISTDNSAAIVTDTPTKTPIESTIVRILSASGIEIGKGTVRVFAPDSVEASQSSIVELELNLDYRYITPTPAGPITPFPVTHVTSTPRPGRATATPREPIYEENDITAYQRMGATLYCPTDRFTGCDVTEDPSRAKVINWTTGAKWSWIIAPLRDVSGPQNMLLKLWTIKQVNDGPELADPVWDYQFSIEVKSPAEAISIVKVIQDNVGIVIIGTFGIGAALIGAGYFTRRKAATARKKASSKKTDKPKIFISYRRIGGTSAAQNIKDRLTEKGAEMARIFISYSRNDEDFARRLAKSLSDLGADIWIDVENIPAGMKWSSAIQQGLQLCDVMIVIVTPGSAASSNVEDEWQYYQDEDKPVIPVLLQPAKVHYQLSRLQYINFHTQDYDTALLKLHTELKNIGVTLKPISVGEKNVPIPVRKPLATLDSRQRGYWMIGAAAVATVLLIGVVGTLINSGQRGQATLTATVTSSATAINTPSATYTSQPSITSVPTNTSTITAATTYPQPTGIVGQIQVSEQDFEHGRMFWIQPRNQIWVIYDNGLNGLSSGQWRLYEDTYQEGDIATDPNIIPPTDKFQPTRSFGKLWRDDPEIGKKLGWGVSPEFGYKAKYEYHPGGMMSYQGIGVPGPGVHVLFSLYGEKIEFNEADSTYKKTSPPVEITATVTAN